MAALTYDPSYLYHLVSALLVTACVIWPALRQQQVSAARRTATCASLRLLYSAATLHSAPLAEGLHRQFLLYMAQGGRWKVSAALAWCHGLLLQVGWPVPHCVCMDVLVP
jgi:hypothetical protein